MPAGPTHINEYALRCAWRVGRRVGRTIYAEPYHAPRDDDPLIGVMDTPALARAAVDAHNEAIGERRNEAS
jgi:hypothetical protein